MTEPIFAEYIGKFQIEAIEFDNLSLGTLPPEIHGNCSAVFSTFTVMRVNANNSTKYAVCL